MSIKNVKLRFKDLHDGITVCLADSTELMDDIKGLSELYIVNLRRLTALGE